MISLVRVIGNHEWTSKYGPMVSIDLDFGDFQAQLNTKPETLGRRLEMCEAWIGKDSDEWAFEDKGTFDNGNPKPKKVISYPGKLVQGGGTTADGGRQSQRGRSPEQFLFEDERIDRRRALEMAVQRDADRLHSAEDIVSMASAFYEWLRSSLPASNPPGAGQPGGALGAPFSPPGSTSTAEAHTGVERPQSTAADSFVSTALDPAEASDRTGPGEALSFGEGDSTRPDAEAASGPVHQHAYRSDPSALGWRICECGDKRKRPT